MFCHEQRDIHKAEWKSEWLAAIEAPEVGPGS